MSQQRYIADFFPTQAASLRKVPNLAWLPDIACDYLVPTPLATSVAPTWWYLHLHGKAKYSFELIVYPLTVTKSVPIMLYIEIFRWRGLETPNFGWHNMWTAPKGLEAILDQNGNREVFQESSFFQAG